MRKKFNATEKEIIVDNTALVKKYQPAKILFTKEKITDCKRFEEVKKRRNDQQNDGRSRKQKN